MIFFLHQLARHGRLVLVGGLLVGIAFPDLARALRPWLPEMIAFILFVAALRIGPQEALGKLRDLRLLLSLVLTYQVVVPLVLLAAFWLLGIAGTVATALVLMASASSISGSPNITALMGHDPAPALRLLVLGTAILPLTVIPVFWFVPQLGSVADVAAASGRLLVIIGCAAALAWTVRRLFLDDPSPDALRAIDGVSALAMAVLVVALMSAIGPAIFQRSGMLLTTLAIAVSANLLLQVGAYIFFTLSGAGGEKVAYSVVSGNRNMALFLAALPTAITDPLLLYVGCYQVPMYLTPYLLGWLYRRAD